MCSTLSIKEDACSDFFFSSCWWWSSFERSTLGGVRRMMGLARDQWRISWGEGETMLLEVLRIGIYSGS